jgi:hypothetical protein
MLAAAGGLHLKVEAVGGVQLKAYDVGGENEPLALPKVHLT